MKTQLDVFRFAAQRSRNFQNADQWLRVLHSQQSAVKVNGASIRRQVTALLSKMSNERCTYASH